MNFEELMADITSAMSEAEYNVSNGSNVVSCDSWWVGKKVDDDYEVIDFHEGDVTEEILADYVTKYPDHYLYVEGRYDSFAT